MTFKKLCSRESSPIMWLLGTSAVWIVAYFIALPNLTHIGLWFQVPSGSLESAISFFLYEVPKVLLLLTAVVFGVGILRTFIQQELHS